MKQRILRPAPPRPKTWKNVRWESVILSVLAPPRPAPPRPTLPENLQKCTGWELITVTFFQVLEKRTGRPAPPQPARPGPKTGENVPAGN